MGTVFASGLSATPVVIMGNSSDGGGSTSPTLGLTATFFSSTTVNTTGTQVLAANTSRKVGVWIHNATATVFAKYGDAFATAAVGGGLPPSHTVTSVPTFIPGTGAVYVMALTTPVNISGYWV